MHLNALFFIFGVLISSAVFFILSRKTKNNHEQQRAFFENEKRTIAKIERFAALGDFGAGIAHEINNPLAIILGRTQSLRIRIDKDQYSKKDVVDTIDKVETAVKRISKIVNSLRLMTKDSSEEQASLVSVTTLLEDIEAVWSARLKNNGFEFTLENNFPDGMFLIKRTQVAHSLFNLISNSFEYLKNQDQKWIKIEVSENAGKIHIAITDSGNGISEEVRQKMFEPFFTTKEVGKGTGLGLSIARGVAEDNAGELIYDANSPNTRFIFALPKIESPQKVVA